MDQFKFDELRFSDLLSKYTGINKVKIDSYLKNNPINNIIEHPAALGLSSIQIKKIEELKELRSLYNNLKTCDAKKYIVNSSSKAGEYFKQYFRDLNDKERFVCAFLDSQNSIIATKVMNVGTVTEAPVYPREIVKEALSHDANTVILSHQHPGGSITPSSADLQVTKLITSALETVNIRVMDHIIVGGDKYTSLAEKGIINEIGPTYNLNEKEVKYMKFNNKEIANDDILGKVINQYKDNFPAIKFITKKTAQVINELNSKNETILSINNIKQVYTETGKRLEVNNTIEIIEEFEILDEVIKDLKFAQLSNNQEMAQNKNIEANSSKIKSLDLEQ